MARESSNDKSKRETKSPAERATERVEVLTRKLAKLKLRRELLEEQVEGIKREEQAEGKRLAYAKQDPDLPSDAGDEPLSYDAEDGQQ